MASGGSDTPHRQTTKVMHITAADYGPLNTVPGEHYNNFRGGSYYMTTPTNNVLVLHRLHGGRASPDGQYWTVEERLGQEAYRYDYAVKEHWNSLQNETTLLVPRGVYLYEGPASSQGHYFGGGWQVFIPKDVLRPLIERQRCITGGTQNPEMVRIAIEAVSTAQGNILSSWQEERFQVLKEQAKKFATRGSCVHKLPKEIRDVLQNGGRSNGVRLQGGTYTVHQESLPYPDGSTQTVTLSVEVKYDRTTPRTYMSGNTEVTEKTYHYIIIYKWH